MVHFFAVEVHHCSPITELGDVQEIILALMKFHGIDPGEFEKVRFQRLEERGGFEKRIKLLWTD